MSSHPPVLKGAWSDAEKLALLVSIIKSNGNAPKWSNGIAVPEGRTLQASAKMYEGILKASAGVKMTQGDAVTPSGKRPRVGGSNNLFAGNGDDTDGTPTKKRRNAVMSIADGTKKAKKVKKGGKPNMAEPMDDSEEGLNGSEDEEQKPKKRVKQEEAEEGQDAI